MDGYLLDTNVVIDMMRPRADRHQAVWRRFRECPEGAPVYLSSISRGELDVGCCLGAADKEAARHEMDEFLRNHGIQPRTISDHTPQSYGDLKARAMRTYNREKVKKGARWPEVWPEPSTGKELGIDENDIWIAAQAIEHNLVLVTHDRLARLTEVAPELRVEGWTDDLPGQ